MYRRRHKEGRVVWRLLPTHKHIINSKGEIWSIPKGRYLKMGMSGDGYRYVRFEHRGRSYRVHRLVAEQFLPDPQDPEKWQCDHIDGNRLNNNVENLRWVTPKENQKNWRENHQKPVDEHNAKSRRAGTKIARKYHRNPKRRKYMREYMRRYRQTEEGRENERKAQRRYEKRLREQKK